MFLKIQIYQIISSTLGTDLCFGQPELQIRIVVPLSVSIAVLRWFSFPSYFFSIPHSFFHRSSSLKLHLRGAPKSWRSVGHCLSVATQWSSRKGDSQLLATEYRRKAYSRALKFARCAAVAISTGESGISERSLNCTAIGQR